MKKNIYKLLYTLLALSMVFEIYAINNHLTLNEVANKIKWKCDWQWLENSWVNYISYLLYIVLLVLFVWILQKNTPRLLPHINEIQNISSIEPASDGMMITYFGLFFFALSVEELDSLIIMVLLLLVCLLLSNVYMFNPLFCIIKYKFYYITFASKKKCLLISKEKFEHGDTVKFEKLYKLNEFTYIDIN